MVTCKLYGRMGNQMFQIAATIGYACRRGIQYHIPDKTINNITWPPRFTHLTNPLFKEGSPVKIIKEYRHSYQEMAYYPGQDIMLDGYWQSIKYFEDCIDEVRKAFDFRYNITMPSTCALHIRLGDYLSYPSHHPIITREYITKAVSEVVSAGAKQILIFSDQPVQAASMVEDHKFPGILFSPVTDTTDVEDFQRILSCPYIIISNSTFSLMAAILNKQSNKFVISPYSDNWFGPGNKHLETCDIIPAQFKQIPYQI